MKSLNVALIGCGTVGLRRLKYFNKKFILNACADKDIDTLNKAFPKKKIFLTKNWRDLLKLENLDAVFIATYHSIQSEIIKEFLKKNVHVFCEKPGGISIKKTYELIKLAKSKRKISIKFGYNHRFHPGFILAKKIISKNELGNILYIRAVYGHGGRKNYHKEWRFNKKLSGGGELIDKGSHLIDLSRFFLGKLKVHSSFLNNYFWKTKLEDNCFICLKNNKNKFSFLHSSSTEWKNKFIFEIFFQFGKIEINGLGKSYGKEKLRLYKMSSRMGLPTKKDYNFSLSDVNNSWKKEVDEFYESIITSKRCHPNLNDVLNNLKIINKIYQNDNS